MEFKKESQPEEQGFVSSFPAGIESKSSRKELEAYCTLVASIRVIGVNMSM